MQDQTLTISSAVTISDNGTVMAPLRFVSESLGADVTYNSESGEIVIVSAGGLDSGVNYKLLFKYTEKEKIGNSKEHWRFTKTDNFDMSESSYGSSYRFSMNDISFTIKKSEKRRNQFFRTILSFNAKIIFIKLQPKCNV